MIPVRLSIHNFMCYRDVPSLDFGGLHLACLSGDNGNGKSALVDAMTWALWGKARASSDDDLIYLGQTDMEVEFEFAMGEQIYRIVRKRSRPRGRSRTGQSVLELYAGGDGGFQTITGNSIAQTQKKITEELLHMDYDTFINSAYLRQGHADEFTIKQPARRKEVLADILRLSIYDELEDRAKELAKQREMTKQQAEGALGDIGAELDQKPALEAELEQVQAGLARIEQAVAAHDARLREIQQHKEALEQKQVHREQLEAHLSQSARDAGLWEEQLEQHRARIKAYQELLSRRAAIEDGYARFVQARRQKEELDKKLRTRAGLNEHRYQLERQIDQARQNIIREHDLVQQKIADLESRAGKLPELKEQARQVQALLHNLDEQEKLLSDRKRECQQMQEEVSELTAAASSLTREISAIDEKLGLLAGQAEAVCPLCETELGIEGVQRIESKYASEKKARSEAASTKKQELEHKKLAFSSLQKEITDAEARLRQKRETARGNARVIENELANAEEAGTQLAGHKQTLEDIEQRLASQDFATAEQQTLRKIEAELAALQYSPEQHEQVQKSLAELEEYDKLQRQLDEADRLIDQEKEGATRAGAAVEKLRQDRQADGKKIQELDVELASLPRFVEDLARAEGEKQELAAERNQVQEQLWQVRSRLQHLAEQEAKKKEKEALMAQAAREEGVYRELARAFGKGGVQAMIIETALPEIEYEANRLLGRMTDNRMHLKFDTQRESKKGDVIDTLDINISDELGIRSYEMFSGGEAFRINFAVRIALSRLLAKRAGTPLRTLIIDEGFGTQDSTGIEKLKEAINTIQDDFDRVLVITHIEELRDSFPNRIDVVKTAEGSTITVS